MLVEGTFVDEYYMAKILKDSPLNCLMVLPKTFEMPKASRGKSSRLYKLLAF